MTAQAVFSITTRQQKGIALLSVLLVTTVAAVLVAQMMRHTSGSMQMAQQSSEGLQAYWYARSGVSFARQVLFEDVQKDTASPDEAPVDHLKEAWAEQFAPFDIEKGTVAVKVIDLQSRLNVNNLRGPQAEQAKATLAGLFSKLGISKRALPEIEALLGRQELLDIRELSYLESLGDAELARLSTYIVALPEFASKLNVNTASETLLAATLGNKSQHEARKIVNARKKEPIRTIAGEPFSNYHGTSTTLDVKSRFFEIQSVARFSGQVKHLMARVERDSEKGIRLLQSVEGPAAVKELLVGLDQQ